MFLIVLWVNAFSGWASVGVLNVGVCSVGECL